MRECHFTNTKPATLELRGKENYLPTNRFPGKGQLATQQGGNNIDMEDDLTPIQKHSQQITPRTNICVPRQYKVQSLLHLYTSDLTAVKMKRLDANQPMVVVLASLYLP